MNILLSLTSIVLLILLTSNYLVPTSAHFYPNVSSIPPSSIPNKTQWDEFANFTGCHKGVKADGLHKLKQYFNYFGYLNNSYNDFSSDQFDENFESAVKAYQLNFKLNTTGELDAQTISHIIQPRCGNPDVINGTTTMNSRTPYVSNSTTGTTVAHYSFFPNRPRWPRTMSNLTYAFSPENQLSPDVRAVFTLAFERWSEVVPLTFTETTSYSRANIRIGFFTGDHGDGEPFDGVMGTLAHAFAPTVGRLHYDGDENWIIDGNFRDVSRLSGIDLESVTVHEIGHLLGLGHSSVEEAVMYPTIRSGSRKVELDRDDVLGVQELYGSNPGYNWTEPTLTPRGESDTSDGSSGLGLMWRYGMLLVLGLFSHLLL